MDDDEIVTDNEADVKRDKIITDVDGSESSIITSGDAFCVHDTHR